MSGLCEYLFGSETRYKYGYTGSNRNSLAFYAEIHIIFGTVCVVAVFVKTVCVQAVMCSIHVEWSITAYWEVTQLRLSHRIKDDRMEKYSCLIVFISK